MKYKILEYDAIRFDGVDCYRIQAVTDFYRMDCVKVHKGDLGGYVSSEENLSQEGYCWLDSNSIAAKNSKVLGHAIITNSSRISGNAVIKDYSGVSNSVIKDNAIVKGFSMVINKSTVKGSSIISNVKVDNSIIDIENAIECEKNCSIIFSKSSLVKSFDLNAINIFNKELYSFTLENAHLTSPDDCCVIPLYYLDECDFFVKYNSSIGPMIYNSNNGKNLTIDEFKKEAINLFKFYEDEKPVSAQIVKPFIDWVKSYKPNTSTVFKNLANNIVNKLSSDYPIVAEKKSSLPLNRIADYLELHFLSLPWLLGAAFNESYKPCIVDLIEDIIENSLLDISCKEIVGFGDKVFLNTPLFRAILSSCFYPKKIPKGFNLTSGKNVVILVI